jgi:hypothetical protein
MDLQRMVSVPLRATAYGCVKDAPHSIPDVQDGAEQITADVIASRHR